MTRSRILWKLLIIFALGCARMEDGGAEAPTSKVAAAPREEPPAPPAVEQAPASLPPLKDPARRLDDEEADDEAGYEVQEKAFEEVAVKPRAKEKARPRDLAAPRFRRARNEDGPFEPSDVPNAPIQAPAPPQVPKIVERSIVVAPEPAADPAPVEPAAEDFDDLGGRLDDGKRDATKQAEGRMGGRAGRAIDAALAERGEDGQRALAQPPLAGQERPPPDAGLLDDGWLASAAPKPTRFLPSMFYFENTYLGRTAHFIERLRRLDAVWPGEGPFHLASLPPQAVDPPEDKGLSLAVALDRTWVEAPGWVYLQVTLQGSSRFGWRRPPLDVAVVVDAGAARRRPEQVVAALLRLLESLGPQDRLGVVLAGEPPVVLAEVGDLRATRRALGRLEGRRQGGAAGLPAAMQVAGERLLAASQGQARVPGAQTVLLIVDGDTGAEGAVGPAHRLTVQGATTSVIELGGAWAWWPVANAGHGNLHRVADGQVAAAVDAELDRISQVIARLLRVNIRLAPGVQATRVLGSRVLEAEEVRQVKAREEATDRQLSATLGVKADRGSDDDGIQTVIPFFYGGDTHVIAVELWVEKPGPVAEISLKYKDMVALENATAQASARVGGVRRPATEAELAVRRNVRGFRLAESLDEAGRLVARGETQRALEVLGRTQADAGHDAALLAGFREALRGRVVDPQVLSEALGFAGQRRISHGALDPR